MSLSLENENNLEFFLDPRLKKLSEDKMSEWRNWFDSRLDDAIEAASTQQHPDIERKRMPVICFVFD